MAKFFLIIGLVVGLIFAVLFIRKIVYFKEDMVKYQEKHAPASGNPAQAGVVTSTANAPQEQTPIVTFSYEKSDQYLSTPDSPYASPDKDYLPGRATGQGLVVQSKNGVALVQSAPYDTKYIVTDTGRPEHRKVRFYGHSSFPLIIHAECPESEIRGVMGYGLWENKDVGYGRVRSVSTAAVVIDRFTDGGITILTPADRERGPSSPSPAPRNERVQAVQTLAPPAEPPPLGGGGVAAPPRRGLSL